MNCTLTLPGAIASVCNSRVFALMIFGLIEPDVDDTVALPFVMVMLVNLPVYWPSGILVEELVPSQVLILELLILRLPLPATTPRLEAAGTSFCPETDKSSSFGEMKVTLEVLAKLIIARFAALWLILIVVPALKSIDWFLLSWIAPPLVVAGQSNLKFWPNT